MDKVLEFAALGCYCEYDLFGIETTHYQQNEQFDMPGDAIRIQMIKSLVDDGYEDKITIAHDIHTKHRLVRIYNLLHTLREYATLCTYNKAGSQ